MVKVPRILIEALQILIFSRPKKLYTYTSKTLYMDFEACQRVLHFEVEVYSCLYGLNQLYSSEIHGCEQLLVPD